jgi:quercetin dioxygenase-like cupin family protein
LFLYVDTKPGAGPAPDKHSYAEVLIVMEGRSMFIAGDEERIVRAGEIVVVPGAAAPHLQNGPDPAGPDRHPD